ncbi:G-type lectin S-receptor-like serine/threonine-protein kinase [Forsythia ovata]|uniref:G-type lectin S-receptor-like serine/threonine-protein kinase n=1 Tax=Forsythia ovata TaxID=205694 RepID=A0ABD1RYP3_9LAMI
MGKRGPSSPPTQNSSSYNPTSSLLASSTSTTPVWSSGTGNLSVTAVALENFENLILKNAFGSAVWTSFDHPTDAEFHQEFQLHQPNSRHSIYWDPHTFDPTLPNPLKLAYSSDYAEEGNILRFLKFDNDGNLRIYSSAIGNRTQIERWAAVDDQCQVYGFCGNMGICSYNDSNPICRCPLDNFELIDKRENKKGCKRKVELWDCLGRETMLPLEHSIFLTYPPELFYRKFTYPPELSSYQREVVSESTIINSDGMHSDEVLNKDSR